MWRAPWYWRDHDSQRGRLTGAMLMPLASLLSDWFPHKHESFQEFTAHYWCDWAQCRAAQLMGAATELTKAFRCFDSQPIQRDEKYGVIKLIGKDGSRRPHQSCVRYAVIPYMKLIWYCQVERENWIIIRLLGQDYAVYIIFINWKLIWFGKDKVLHFYFLFTVYM